MQYELSQREKQVARLILKGKNPIEIGKELGISATTVRNYSLNLRQKTGFPSSTREAARIAKERGML